MFYMFVLDETHVRGVKLIYGCFLVINVQEIIPKDHHRILKEGHKNHCAGCPRQTLVTEQSTASRGSEAPSKWSIMMDLALSEELKLWAATIANDGGCDCPSRW